MPTPTALTALTVGSTSLATLAGQCANATFIGQVAVAIAATAQLVLGEDSGASAGYYPDDAARQKLASLVITNPLSWATQTFVYAFVADMVTTSSSTDNQLLARALAVWSDVADVYGTSS